MQAGEILCYLKRVPEGFQPRDFVSNEIGASYQLCTDELNTKPFTGVDPLTTPFGNATGTILSHQTVCFPHAMQKDFGEERDSVDNHQVTVRAVNLGSLCLTFGPVGACFGA